VKWGIIAEMVGGIERIKVPFGINPNFIVDHGHDHQSITNIINQIEILGQILFFLFFIFFLFLGQFVCIILYLIYNVLILTF
jgi:hypothetical protein